MKNRVWLLVILSSAILALGTRASAQDASIEFVAHATPSGGLEEPVRGFPFFLLSRSFVEIGKEAEATYPKPDMDAFIAKLDVSPELKAWMKKNDWVMLAGEDFIHKLHPDDILAIPEFKTAYMDRNAGDQSADFPKATEDQSVGPGEKPGEIRQACRRLRGNNPALYRTASPERRRNRSEPGQH